MGTSQPQAAYWAITPLLPAQGEAEKRRGAHGRLGSEQSEDFTSFESLAEQPVLEIGIGHGVEIFEIARISDFAR